MNGTDDFWTEVKYRWFKIFGCVALVGWFLLVSAYFIKVDEISLTLTVFAVLAIEPFAIHMNLITTCHRKSRYKGSHSKFWGAVLIFEMLGFCKLIYLFMHVMPDRGGRGRYVLIQP